MNKTKRNIVTLQAAMAKKMTMKVRHASPDIRKEVNAVFKDVNYSMPKAAKEAAKLTTPKLARLGRALMQESKVEGKVWFYQWGNFYDAKMLMMMAVSRAWFEACLKKTRKYQHGYLRDDVLMTMAFFHP